MKIELLKYQLHVTYTSGKLIHIADLLSRSYLEENLSEDYWISEVVPSISSGLNISNKKKLSFKPLRNQILFLIKLENIIIRVGLRKKRKLNR